MENRANRTQLKTKVVGCLIIDESFQLLNISDSGSLITTSQKLLLGSTYVLRFDFLDRDEKIDFSVKSKVVREKLREFTPNKRGGNMAIYEVGLAFCDVSTNDISKLKLFIAKKELMKVKQ